MPTPIPRKKILKNSPKSSTTIRPPYNSTLPAGRITSATTMTATRLTTDSPASHSLLRSGRNRSTVNTRKASAVSANSGVSRCRLVVKLVVIAMANNFGI